MKEYQFENQEQNEYVLRKKILVEKFQKKFQKIPMFLKNFFDIFLKTKSNLENLICDGSLSLIGYAAVWILLCVANIKI